MSKIGKDLRLSRIFSEDKNVIIDTSFVNVIGTPKNLSDLGKFLTEISDFSDAIILNPGNIDEFIKLNKKIPLILRCNWTNVLRDNIKSPKLFKTLTPSEALYLGADAIISYFVLGGNEEFEKENISLISYFAQDAEKRGIPVIADLVIKGEKIEKKNFDETTKLAVSILQEIGVDAICVPSVEDKIFEEIKGLCKVNLILNDKIENFYKLNVQAIKLGYEFLKKDDYLDILKNERRKNN